MSDATVESRVPDLSAVSTKLELEEGETAEGKYVELLDLARHGRYRLDELADGLGISGVEVEHIVGAAEREGDLFRDGYSGMALYSIRLTEQGREKILDLSDREADLAEYGLTRRDWETLKILAVHDSCSAQDILEHYPGEIAPMKLIPVVNYLVRRGYCDESGLWRRIVQITDEGRSVVEELREDAD